MFEGLNEQQQKAVHTVDGPLLVLAGAGSGKTRVLTCRIAYLIGAMGVRPGQVLAMTFTNKAAGEMRERVEALLNRSSRGMWIGTFHSLCARILRMEADALGLQSNFSIYDPDDQLVLLRQVIRDQEVSDKQFPPRRVRARISREKNRMVDPGMFAQEAGTFYEQQVARIYRQYQEALRQNCAVDFDDLLMLSVRLFQDNPDILKKYQERFRYCLIDEYQDTNRPQYLFAHMLTQTHGNLCVVGDDDQSIYAWRGADLRNILDFEVDFPNARVIRLERNYRSTSVILGAGNAVIRNNLGRKGKELWTDRTGGEKIRLKRCMDEVEEAGWITGMMRDLQRQYTYRDMAVLYRTNAQSRALEEGLRRAGIPYVVVGGVRFYERKEVKDILAYLRLIVNPRDSISLGRIINTPRRGIGEASVARLDDFAMREGIAPYWALERLDEIEEVPARTGRAMAAFYGMMEGFRDDMAALPADQLVAQVVDRTGYWRALEALGPVEAESRTENVKELLAAIQDFTERAEDASLEAFLREVSLVTDVDQWDEKVLCVTLMTLHAAKGLEFPVVFIGGMEEGLFPIWGGRDEDREKALEEERRLCYVGITRAKERLFLSYAMQRRRYGGASGSAGSRFLTEIPEELLDLGFHISEAEAERDEGGAPFSLEVGTWIVHPSWGRGQIHARSGYGQEARLTVRFGNGTTKKVVVKYAGLKPG